MYYVLCVYEEGNDYIIGGAECRVSDGIVLRSMCENGFLEAHGS